MRHLTIGDSSLKTSVLGIGGLHFGVFCDQKITSDIISRTLSLGINFIETSPIYGSGKSETLIGNAVRGRRGKFVISTKVGLKPVVTKEGIFGVESLKLTRSYIRSSIEKSLAALQTSYIDLYQLHAFDHETAFEETLDAMNELVKEGKVRAIGCSNYSPEELESAYHSINGKKGESHTAFNSFQVHYNLMERRAEEKVVQLCKTHHLTMIINRALARGILTGKYKKDQPLPGESRAKTSIRIRKWLDDETLALVAELERFALSQGHTAAQLAYAWIFSQHQNALALMGARSPEQVEENAKAATWQLSTSDLDHINEIIKSFNLMETVKRRPETFFEK